MVTSAARFACLDDWVEARAGLRVSSVSRRLARLEGVRSAIGEPSYVAGMRLKYSPLAARVSPYMRRTSDSRAHSSGSSRCREGCPMLEGCLG